MDQVVDQLEHIGITASVRTYDIPEDSWYMACIFWCQHAAVIPNFELCCRCVLNRSARAIVVRLDESLLPNFLEAIPSIGLREARHRPGAESRGVHSPEWQESVRALIRAIQFDANEIMEGIVASIAKLKSFLSLSEPNERYFGPLWEDVQSGISAAVTVAFLLGAFSVLRSFLFESSLVLVPVFLLLLFISYFFVMPYLLCLLAQEFKFDIDPLNFGMLAPVFGGVVYATVWAACAIFGHLDTSFQQSIAQLPAADRFIIKPWFLSIIILLMYTITFNMIVITCIMTVWILPKPSVPSHKTIQR
jgi:hypothetical protein